MTFSGNPPEPTSIELSDEELDQISGGVDVVITGVLFEQDVAIQKNSTSSTFFSHTSATVFQFVGTGFDSMKDAFSFLSSFSRLLGR